MYLGVYCSYGCVCVYAEGSCSHDAHARHAWLHLAPLQMSFSKLVAVTTGQPYGCAWLHLSKVTFVKGGEQCRPLGMASYGVLEGCLQGSLVGFGYWDMQHVTCCSVWLHPAVGFSLLSDIQAVTGGSAVHVKKLASGNSLTDSCRPNQLTTIRNTACRKQCQER